MTTNGVPAPSLDDGTQTNGVSSQPDGVQIDKSPSPTGLAGLRRWPDFLFKRAVECGIAEPVFELRMPKTERGTISGYFESPDALARVASQLNSGHTFEWEAIYATLNPVSPELLARARNRIRLWAKHTTDDKSIVRRILFGIDLDPDRPSGIPSTDAEHTAALARSRAVRDWLTAQGWPLPVVCDSGNGGHLVYAIDLPNNAESTRLIEACLAVIAARFPGEKRGVCDGGIRILVDTSVSNAGRIWKIYGTHTRKGDSTADRPHRDACILAMPETLATVPREALVALAAMAADQGSATPTTTGKASGKRTATSTEKTETGALYDPTLDMPAWAARLNFTITKTKPFGDGATLYELDRCPLDAQHANRAACVIKFSSGWVKAKCHHNGCKGKGWRDWLIAVGDSLPDEPPADAGTARRPSVLAQILEPQVAKAVRKKFERDEEGRIKQTQKNVLLAMEAFGVTLSFDEFARHQLIRGLEGFGPRLDDDAVNRLRMAIDGELGFRVGKEYFTDFINDQAQLNRFHPVRDYFARLTWDRTPRIGDDDHPGWLTTYAGAPDTRYVRAVSRLILVAAVRRVVKPGVKFDEMVILEGDQGCQKSSALCVMAVREDWFTGDLPLGTDTKKLMEVTAGKFIVEAGELKGMTRGDVAALKSCLSRQIDEARMSYGRKNTVVPRQFVIVGTTNEVDGYLKDPTGNRRFWPVRVVHFDLEHLRADRDQLWAEAVEVEAAGESIRLDPKLWGVAAIEQDARRINDPIVDDLRVHLGSITGKLRVIDVWRMLMIEPAKTSQDQIARVGTAMRELGWEYTKQLRFEGERCGAYVRGTKAEREVRLWVEVNPMGNVVKISHVKSESPEHSTQNTFKDRVIATARSRPEGFLSATDLECAVKGNPKDVSALIKALLKTGELEVRDNAIRARDPETSSHEGRAAQDTRSSPTNSVGAPGVPRVPEGSS